MTENDLLTRCKRNYIRGLIFDVVDIKANVIEITDQILSFNKNGPDDLQKVVLGELIEHKKPDVNHNNLIKVSHLIADAIRGDGKKEKKG